MICIVPANHTAAGAYSLEHKKRYGIIISEEWYIFVLQQIHRYFLHRAMHVFGACLYFPPRLTVVVTAE